MNRAVSSVLVAVALAALIHCAADNPPVPATNLASRLDAGTTTPPYGEGDAALADDAGTDPFVPTYFDVNHVLSTGQSLSVGSTAVTILSLTQPFDNLRFDTGVLPSSDSATEFEPLVESERETMSSALANLVTDFAESEVLVGLPLPNNSHRLLVSCTGKGGTSYEGLKKGTVPYERGLRQVREAKSIAEKTQKSYVVRVTTNVHGESDHNKQNEAYDKDLATWQSDMETDIIAITGQTSAIPMLHTQISSWTKLAGKPATSSIPQQQLEASVASNGKIVMVGPKYNFAYASDGVHLTSVGYRQMGEYYAKAYRAIVLEGKPWEPLRPISARLEGDAVVVKFFVPVPPLVLDTDLVKDPGNKGFEFVDGSGEPPTVTNVTLVGPDTVRVQLSQSPTGANKRIRYAFTGVSDASGGLTTGPRGNLRDSDASKSRVGASLFNWAVHFSMAVP